MNTELKKALQARYAALLAERDQFMAQANLKLGEYAGRLAELEAIFKQLTESETPSQAAAPTPELVSIPQS